MGHTTKDTKIIYPKYYHWLTNYIFSKHQKQIHPNEGLKEEGRPMETAPKKQTISFLLNKCTTWNWSYLGKGIN